MKTIDNTIQDLIKIGNKYPEAKTGLFGFFAKHQNQALATLLKNLNELPPDEPKLQAIQRTVSEIFYTAARPGTLVEAIHACLCECDSFQDYKAASERRVKEYNDNVLESGGYDIKLTMSITDYREAFGCWHPIPAASNEEYRS